MLIENNKCMAKYYFDVLEEKYFIIIFIRNSFLFFLPE